MNATLVSIVPFPIIEFKPGIYPGHFAIGACNDHNKPEVLIIGESIFHVELDEDRTITVKVSPDDMARSLVDDYLTSNLEYSEPTKDDAMPGLFWKSGEFSSQSIVSTFKSDLKLAQERQYRWFKKLVERADDDWEKTRQHKTIADMQRYAARALNLERPWIINTKMEGQGSIKCPACMSIIPEEAIVCASCKCIIKLDSWKKLQFAESK